MAEHTIGVVKACIGLDDGTFQSGRIQDDLRLERAFVRKVVLRIQYLLEVGFEVAVDQVFAMLGSGFECRAPRMSALASYSPQA